MNYREPIRLLIRGIMLLGVVCAIVLFIYTPQWISYIYQDKSISILVWPEELDGEYLVDFERDTGIKVYINYLETNEELLVKLKATQGKGYDLVMLSDYAVELMIQEKLLQKIDKNKLKFWNMFNPALLHHYYDPFNDYAIPFYWNIYGIGVNKDYFCSQLPEPTWGWLFEKGKAPGSIGMTDDAREIVLIIAQYLFGTIENNYDNEKLLQIQQVLQNQKEWVEMYTEVRTAYLLESGTVPVSLTLMSEILRLKFSSSYPIDFIIPKEGSFVIIDNCSIPSGSTKQDYVYTFLNYLYSKKIMQKYVDKYGLFPVLKNISFKYNPIYFNESILPYLGRLNFFKNVLNERTINNIWLAAMS